MFDKRYISGIINCKLNEFDLPNEGVARCFIIFKNTRHVQDFTTYGPPPAPPPLITYDFNIGIDTCFDVIPGGSENVVENANTLPFIWQVIRLSENRIKELLNNGNIVIDETFKIPKLSFDCNYELCLYESYSESESESDYESE